VKPHVLSTLHPSSSPPGYQDSEEPTTPALPAGLPANNTLQDSLSKAREMLGDGDRSDRMLIIMLSRRHDRLCCVFQNLPRTVFPLTPSDLLIFSINNSAEGSVNADCPPVSMHLTNIWTNTGIRRRRPARLRPGRRRIGGARDSGAWAAGGCRCVLVQTSARKSSITVCRRSFSLIVAYRRNVAEMPAFLQNCRHQFVLQN